MKQTLTFEQLTVEQAEIVQKVWNFADPREYRYDVVTVAGICAIGLALEQEQPDAHLDHDV